MAAQLEIAMPDDNTGRVVVSGELDTHTAPVLEEHLDGIPADRSIELDLAATTFISSAGLSAILNAQRRQASGGGSLTVVAADPNVKRTIELSGLAETLGLSE